MSEIVVHVDPFQGGETACYWESPYAIARVISPLLARNVWEGSTPRRHLRRPYGCLVQVSNYLRCV